MKPLAVAMSLLLLMHGLPAHAQLADPTRTRSTTQVAPPPPPPPPVRQIELVRPPQPPQMPTTLGQRDQAPPIQAPAQARPPQQQEDPLRIGATPAKVYDRNGRALNGMEQAGPNRVLDTATGRYYNTVPMGDGQRIGP